MPCYYPLTAFRSRHKSSKGTFGITFRRDESIGIEEQLPCGKCIGCRIDYSRSWAVRCMHESSLHASNCFITLTYSPEHIPPNGTLVKRDFQLFMKSLRKHYTGTRIRFFHCGEYGAKLARPHYHALIFGLDFDDKKLWKQTKAGNLYISATLSRLWPKGFSTIGAVTFETAAYVARYALKKINGEQKDQHYRTLDQETGELVPIQQEYITMSRNKGIAYEWFKKYKTDVFPSDEVILKGKKLRPPRYYQNIFQHEEPEAFEAIKEKRKIEAKAFKTDNTPERRHVKAQCQAAKLKQTSRSYEDKTE